MRFFILLFLLWLASLHSVATAQIIIKGNVTDSVTSKPIGYASIGVGGSKTGAITNEEGMFECKVTHLPCTLHVYALGYHPQSIVVATYKTKISLSPSSINLAEVVVKANEAEVLFFKAFKQLKKQKHQFYQADCFFRLLSKNDDTYTELIESFYKSTINPYGIKYWELEQGRYALLKEYASKQFAVSTDFSQLTRNLDLLNRHETAIPFPHFPFIGNALTFYRISIADKFHSGSERITKIKCATKIPDDPRFFNAYIYINEKDFTIQRVEAWVNNTPNPPFFLFNKNVAIANCSFSFDLLFQSHQKQQVLNSVGMKLSYDQKNKSNGNIIHHVNTYSNLIAYHYSPEPVKPVSGTTEHYETDYDHIKNRLYRKAFWDNQAILLETQLEKEIRESFERNGSFGRAFNTSNDTVELVKEGYKIWNEHSPFYTQHITMHHDNGVRVEQTELTIEGKPVAGLYGDLFFAWDCDSGRFRHCALALMDLKATWLDETLMKDTNTITQRQVIEVLYQCYFDILELYKRKLNQALLAIPDICANKPEITRAYQKLKTEWYNEEMNFLRSTWGNEGSGLARWRRDIEQQLKELEAYR